MPSRRNIEQLAGRKYFPGIHDVPPMPNNQYKTTCRDCGAYGVIRYIHTEWTHERPLCERCGETRLMMEELKKLTP